jgi:hypothetical protein
MISRSGAAPWAIICVVYERRQRSCLAGAGPALGAAVLAFGILAAGACTPVSPTASRATPTPTAVPPGQDAVSGAQTAVSGAQTALPAAQSTLQAAATAAANVAASPQFQYVVQVLTSILGGGVRLQIEQEPMDVPNTQVTSVRLRATDASGAFSALDRDGREKTAAAVLLATSQFYPQATVDLLIVDGSNRTLMTGSRSPGEPPKLDQ